MTVHLDSTLKEESRVVRFLADASSTEVLSELEEQLRQVKVEGVASEKQLERLRKGMMIEGEEMGGL